MIQIDVTIMGQPYRLACKEDEERTLRDNVETEKLARFGAELQEIEHIVEPRDETVNGLTIERRDPGLVQRVHHVVRGPVVTLVAWSSNNDCHVAPSSSVFHSPLVA